ncbi:MAG: glycosyltransferase family 4 protein [Rhodobacteraceae bacterium]|nr:glycosyltransferase family 4 protein [Paracoccaceae bacterium]
MASGDGKKLLFLTRHEWLGASTRYRSVQFFPLLEELGFSVMQRPLFSDCYLKQRISGRRPLALIACRLANRLLTIRRDLKEADAVIIEKELFPFLPAISERLAHKKGVPLIYDFDDAIWHAYERQYAGPYGPILANKIARIIRRADHIVVGSHYLEKQIQDWGAAPVSLFPTTVPQASYYGQGRDTKKTTAIVWIGSMSTGRYLLPVFPVFARLAAETGARVRAIGFSRQLLTGTVPDWLDIEPWHPDTEIDLMASGNIGIMPIPDEPFERGKCGFKLVQYMGLGLPIVASPVGENRFILQDGKTGLLADSNDEWYRAIKTLLNNPVAAANMGRLGHDVFLSRYSTEQVAKHWAALLSALINKARR